MYYIDLFNANEPSELEIAGESFQQLLALCFQRSDYLSLTVGPWSNSADEMQTKLAPHIYKEITVSRWFCYITRSDNPIRRIMYPVKSETIDIIKKYYKSFWLYTDARGHNQALEDLCFFSNDKLLLGTVSHEYICQVFPPDEVFTSKLLKVFGNWHQRDDYSEQIRLSDYINVQD